MIPLRTRVRLTIWLDRIGGEWSVCGNRMGRFACTRRYGHRGRRHAYLDQHLAATWTST